MRQIDRFERGILLIRLFQHGHDESLVLKKGKRECSSIVPFSGSERGAAERSGEIYLRWERSSSEISAIGAMAERVLVSNADNEKARDEPTGKTGLKIAVALIC